MQKIPLKLAKPGFVLAKPVLRDNGMVLLAEGTELSESLLTRLEDMDVAAVVVKGEPVDMEGAAGSGGFAKRLERLDHLFRRYKADPWMGRVKERLREHFKIKAAAESGPAEPEAGE